MAIRLMLADDHRMLREGLRRSMTDAGFDVIGEAGDGVEAVKLALQLSPDVILMDVTMPNCDGVEACRQVKSTSNDTKVVMLTMHADQDVLTNAIRAGAIGMQYVRLFSCCCICPIAPSPRAQLRACVC